MKEKPLFERFNQSTFYFLPLVIDHNPLSDPEFIDSEYNHKEKSVDVYYNTGTIITLPIPEHFHNDLDNFMAGNLRALSPTYRDKLNLIWPELKEKFTKKFNRR